MINDYRCDCSQCYYHQLQYMKEEYNQRLKKLESDKFNDWSKQINALQTGLNNVYNQFLELSGGEYIKILKEKERELNIKIESFEHEKKRIYDEFNKVWHDVEDLKDVSDFREALRYRHESRSYGENQKEINQEMLAKMKKELKEKELKE